MGGTPEATERRKAQGVLQPETLPLHLRITLSSLGDGSEPDYHSRSSNTVTCE